MKTTFTLAAMAVLLEGCSGIQRNPPIQVWDDMKHQPKFKAQSEIGVVFEHGRVSQLPVMDTVARGHYLEDSPYNTGMEGGQYVGRVPVPVNLELLRQGQTKFNIYCAPCHDQTGMGKGVVPTRVPAWQPSNLTEERLVQAADGDLFNVITHGRRTMPAYQFQIPIADRWAIVSYVRVLQRAAHGQSNDVPAGTAIEGKQ